MRYLVIALFLTSCFISNPTQAESLCERSRSFFSAMVSNAITKVMIGPGYYTSRSNAHRELRAMYNSNIDKNVRLDGVVCVHDMERRISQQKKNIRDMLTILHQDFNRKISREEIYAILSK